MDASDIFRGLVFLFAGVGAGFAIATNILAFKVLRPPKKLGFLWWHVTSVTVAFFLWGSVVLYYSLMRLGEPISWRTFASLGGAVVFAVSQTIIFTVERQRWFARRTVDEADNGSE